MSPSRLGERGAVAVEFALIGTGFLGMIAMIAVIASFFFVQSAMDSIAASAARVMQVSSTRRLAQSYDGFRATALCPAMTSLLDCGNVTVILLPVTPDYKTYMELNLPIGSNPPSVMPPYNAGGNGDQMVMFLYYNLNFVGSPIPISYVLGTAAYQNEQ